MLLPLLRLTVASQVVVENIKLERELEEHRAARKMAAEICRTGKPLLFTSMNPHAQAAASFVEPNIIVGKSKKKRLNGAAIDIMQVCPEATAEYSPMSYLN